MSWFTSLFVGPTGGAVDLPAGSFCDVLAPSSSDAGVGAQGSSESEVWLVLTKKNVTAVACDTGEDFLLVTKEPLTADADDEGVPDSLHASMVQPEGGPDDEEEDDATVPELRCKKPANSGSPSGSASLDSGPGASNLFIEAIDTRMPGMLLLSSFVVEAKGKGKKNKKKKHGKRH